jgi:hypothetical protein
MPPAAAARTILRASLASPFLLGRRHLASAAGAPRLITLDHPLTYGTRRQIPPSSTFATSPSEAREAVVGLPHRGLCNFDKPHRTRLFTFDHRVGAIMPWAFVLRFLRLHLGLMV